MKRDISLLIAVLLLFGLLGLFERPVLADVAQIKAYKTAFPEEKPKCTGCHVSSLPKKGEGQHEPNDYGKKVKQLKEKEAPDADSYKAAGKIPS